MNIYTIGFCGKDAETFFGLLEQSRIRTVIDVRLNNRSQLAGFSKAADLPFFLKRIANIQYVHFPVLAPSEEILTAYRNKEIDWDTYVNAFNLLLQQRDIDKFLRQEITAISKPFCLLCSEPKADKCHRLLIAERIKALFPEAEVVHL
ncbi:MAG: hypothetical protein CVU50_02495 [Candidatus Cloacimonetes bacterium HGW-Cloacimonetes-3]|jgi:uncharacterized protein (DUF488 family)|nr:MAG: hypothetical protein CVU50_02495 [Candidatus Cloacimonetes bacterium HGW-Cloacimonetes-3]